VSARSDAVQQQINEMRGSAQAIRKGIEKTTEQVNDWQRKADEARKLVAVLEEKARIWDALADGLDSGLLHSITAALGADADFFDDNTSRRAEGRRAHLVLGKVMDELPSDFEVHAWTIETTADDKTTIKIQHGSGIEPDEFVRQRISSAATVLGLSYVESIKAGYVLVEAVGNVDEVRVEVWDHARRAVEDAEQTAKDAEAADDAMSATERFEHDQADEFAQDAADAERWAEENAANQYDDEHYDVDDEDGEL